MKITEFVVYILIIFLPGILSLIYIRYLTVGKDIVNFLFFIYSAVIGIICYVILEILHWIYFWVKSLLGTIEATELGTNLDIWTSILSQDVQKLPIDELIFAILLSFPLSLLLSKAIQEKWLLSLAKKMSVTNKFGDDDLWTFFLNSKDVYWIFIRDQDNQLIYFGAVSYFSGPEKRRELVLSDVTVFLRVMDE